MDRRAALAALSGVVMAGASGTGAVAAKQADLPPFWKSRLTDVDQSIQQIKKGTTRVLAQSPGKRDVYLATYGPQQDWLSSANYNSACAGKAPASYARKDGQQSPVVFLLGPVHGGEFEGIVGLINLIHIAETGADLRGQQWDSLSENFGKCRVLIVPSANPDGRARCPYDSWVDEELSTHEPIEMGVQPGGENFKWPYVKRFHPMQPGMYRSLGSYFNDAGVNLMHDEWFAPMSAETRAWFELARDEAPDFIVSLHSHAASPSLEPVNYVPRSIKESVKQLGDRVQRRYAQAELPYRQSGGPEPVEDGIDFPPPTFNLSSALHHACGAVSFVYECCVGVKPPYPPLTHAKILDLQLLFFDELFRYAVEQPVNWTINSPNT